MSRLMPSAVKDENRRLIRGHHGRRLGTRCRELQKQVGYHISLHLIPDDPDRPSVNSRNGGGGVRNRSSVRLGQLGLVRYMPANVPEITMGPGGR